MEYNAGKRIQEVAKERGFNAYKLAEALDMTPPTIYKMFYTKDIKVNKLIKISKVLNFNFIEEVLDKMTNANKIQNI